MTSLKGALLAGAAVLALAAAPGQAEAAYAYASNNITGLTVTFADGTALTNISAATTSITDSANFGLAAGATFSGNGLVGAGLDINQATSGSGPFPADNTFTPAGPTLGGTRSDAQIGAGSATSGGVAVRNVAEGSNQVVAGSGNSQAGTTATIAFTLQGDGRAVRVSFSDAIQLTASTNAVPNETANASIGNRFRVVNGAGAVVLDTSPTAINRQVGSANGIPGTDAIALTTVDFTGANSLVTPVLLTGVSYTISLSSASLESVTAGTPVPTPEPASLAILGMGMLGLAAVRRRRSKAG